MILGIACIWRTSGEKLLDHHHQDTGKVENLGPSPLGASGEISTFVWKPWIGLQNKPIKKAQDSWYTVTTFVDG